MHTHTHIGLDGPPSFSRHIYYLSGIQETRQIQDMHVKDKHNQKSKETVVTGEPEIKTRVGGQSSLVWRDIYKRRIAIRSSSQELRAVKKHRDKCR